MFWNKLSWHVHRSVHSKWSLHRLKTSSALSPDCWKWDLAVSISFQNSFRDTLFLRRCLLQSALLLLANVLALWHVNLTSLQPVEHILSHSTRVDLFALHHPCDVGLLCFRQVLLDPSQFGRSSGKNFTHTVTPLERQLPQMLTTDGADSMQLWAWLLAFVLDTQIHQALTNWLENHLDTVAHRLVPHSCGQSHVVLHELQLVPTESIFWKQQLTALQVLWVFATIEVVQVQTHSGSGARLGLDPVIWSQIFQHIIEWLLLQLGGQEGVLDGRHGTDLKQKPAELNVKRLVNKKIAHHTQDAKINATSKTTRMRLSADRRRQYRYGLSKRKIPISDLCSIWSDCDSHQRCPQMAISQLHELLLRFSFYPFQCISSLLRSIATCAS